MISCTDCGGDVMMCSCRPHAAQTRTDLRSLSEMILGALSAGYDVEVAIRRRRDGGVGQLIVPPEWQHHVIECDN